MFVHGGVAASCPTNSALSYPKLLIPLAHIHHPDAGRLIAYTYWLAGRQCDAATSQQSCEQLHDDGQGCVWNSEHDDCSLFWTPNKNVRWSVCTWRGCVHACRGTKQGGDPDCWRIAVPVAASLQPYVRYRRSCPHPYAPALPPNALPASGSPITHPFSTSMQSSHGLTAWRRACMTYTGMRSLLLNTAATEPFGSR